MLIIDGSQGEGGGQVLRTSLSLAALTKRSFRLTNIRAKRSKPGLRPQHLTAVRAVAALCAADVVGDQLDSKMLTFVPQVTPQAGTYYFDVAAAAKGGSAGAVTLILQAILWPLLFANQVSTVTLVGGTHVNFSPSFHYIAHVLAPALARLGVQIELSLDAWGWYPIGKGRVTAVIHPLTQLQSASWLQKEVAPIKGVAAVTNLPAHIPQRLARRALNLLTEAGHTSHIDPIRARGIGPGAGIVLWHPTGGFTSLGRRGLPADKVAETAVTELFTFLAQPGAIDPHLADQLLLPLALANGRSHFTTTEISLHTLTNAQLLKQWLGPNIHVSDQEGKPGEVMVDGCGFTPIVS